MRVRILASAPERSDEKQYLTSFLIDDVVAIDAGSLGLYGEPDDQARVEHVFVTHSHADHIGSLPVFVENAWEDSKSCVTIHGSADVLACLRGDVFNDRVWPDLIDEHADPERPFLELAELTAETPVEVCGLRVTPVRVDHQVPTFGYIVEDGSSAVVFGADSGPTERIWELAARRDGLSTVFLEASFPDEMAELARISGHLTPRLVRAEIAKIPERADVIAIHIKPRYRHRIIAELEALGIARLTIGRCGREYVL